MIKNQMNYILIFVVFIVTLACNKDNDTRLNDEYIKDCNLSESALLIHNKFLQAYNDSCVSCLEQILIDWNNVSKPITNIPDSLKDVYDAYKAFYRPWDLASISDSEWGDDIFKDKYFYIIQSSLKYDYKLSTESGESIIIETFRPEVDNESIKSLYLNDDYQSAINCFLGSDYVPFAEDNIMSPAFADGESTKRYEFLNNFLHFFHGHWGNYWHLETHPEVSNISFNASKDSARVDFRLGYQGGEVTLGKENDDWIIIDHRMTWIE